MPWRYPSISKQQENIYILRHCQLQFSSAECKYIKLTHLLKSTKSMENKQFPNFFSFTFVSKASPGAQSFLYGNEFDFNDNTRTRKNYFLVKGWAARLETLTAT